MTYALDVDCTLEIHVKLSWGRVNKRDGGEEVSGVAGYILTLHGNSDSRPPLPFQVDNSRLMMNSKMTGHRHRKTRNRMTQRDLPSCLGQLRLGTVAPNSLPETGIVLLEAGPRTMLTRH